MTISGVRSPGIPQPGVHQKGASDVHVPAKNASVHNSNTGTKIGELMDPIAPAKLASIVDDQLPPLLSLIIDGLPPMQQSKYVDEAEICMRHYIEHYQNATLLEPYYRAGLSSGSYLHPGVTDVDRLVALSIQYGLMFLVDDLFFDAPSEFLRDQCGVSRSICESPPKIREYLDHLNAIFGQQVQPSDPAPLIETMMWELGRDMLELSNPEWFASFVACVVQHHHASAASHADIVEGRNSCLRDLESYAVMRAGNVGGKLAQSMVEFAIDTYIPGPLRGTPYLENMTIATSIHLGFANDIYSYHRESLIEQNPRNMITVLLECEGQSFVQTAHMAIHLTNAYARTIVDLGAQAWTPVLQSYCHGIKALIAGNVYFCYRDARYRQSDSCFPELRDTTVSWKLVPEPQSPGL